jgi:WD40 repeat protein
MVMTFHLLCRRAIMGLLLVGVTGMTGVSDQTIIEAVRAMEQKFGVTITDSSILPDLVRRAQHIPFGYSHHVSTISPDGTAIAWSSYPVPYNGEKVLFLTVQSLKEGIQPVELEGRVALKPALSSGAEVIVTSARPLDPAQSRNRELLAIDRRGGLAVHNLTRFMTQFDLGNSVGFRVAGTGNLVALEKIDTEQIQVLEIPSGKSVYTGQGSFSRLSPDGKRLAFIKEGMIWIYSFADGSTVKLLKGKRVKGLGGWSPDGRYLLAGAYTSMLALVKRQIIVDTTTGKYAVIDKLGEGNYGTTFAWISTKLLEQLAVKR